VKNHSALKGLNIPRTGKSGSAPMTYMLNGKQYIVLAVASPSEFVAFTLPGPARPRTATGNQQ